MPRLTSSCMNCGNAKTLATLQDDFCHDCFAAIAGAQAKAAAEGADTNAARREALSARAHSAHRNFPDPRNIDRHTIWATANKPTDPIPTELL